MKEIKTHSIATPPVFHSTSVSASKEIKPSLAVNKKDLLYAVANRIERRHSLDDNGFGYKGL